MTMTARQLHPQFAAEVGGFDSAQTVTGNHVDEIVRLLDRYGVLVLRGGLLTQEAQIAFASRFGTLETRTNIITTGIKRRISGHLSDISNLDETGAILDRDSRLRMAALGNFLWHTDSSFKKTPAKYSLLHAHTVVSEGGETEFVDMRAAYEALPAKMKARIDDLVAEHSVFASRAKIGFTDFSDEERRTLPPVRRSIVRIHPGSGRKTLYLASHASHVIGWPVPEGRLLLHELIEHATRPRFVYAHKWSVGDLVIWDNRCTMHRARPYPAGERRDMRRATIEDAATADSERRLAS